MLKSRPKAKVVIIGGGYIGMEVASCIQPYSPGSITMVFPEDHVMARALPAIIAEFYEAKYGQRHG